MESVERTIRTWMGSGRDVEIEETVQGISAGNITLVGVVKSLGEYLTSEDDAIRTKGVDFLSQVIKACPVEKFTRQHTRVLVTFMCGKLDDTETIIPALNALVTLSSLPTCTAVDAQDICRGLFRHVKRDALTAPNRFNLFSIIDSLMSRQRDALKSMREEFLKGYAVIAEGEKDPRNLLTAFAIARVILVEFDITDHVETMFNIVFCYYPISFRPPANDPYGISSDDLKMALRSCLCATPLFGPLAIPVYLDKLAAGSPTSKRDTLQSMSASFPVYGAALARQSAHKIWSALKLEIFQPTDSITEAESLRTTQVLIQTIYADSPDSESSNMEGLAQEACEECVKILREPEKTQARPAIKILCAFMATTATVSRYTVAQAVPHLVKTFLSPDEIPNRAPTTVLLAELVTAAQCSMKNPDNSSEDSAEIFIFPFKDEVLGVFTVGLNTASTRAAALVGLKAMVATPNLLTDEELGFIVHNTEKILQADPDDEEDASEDVIGLLVKISSINSRHLEEQTLPLLFGSLPDMAPSRETASGREKYWRTLSALSKICVQQELFETMVVRLSTKLDLLCGPAGSAGSGTVSDLEPTAAYAHAILTALSNTITTKIGLGHADVPKYVDRLVSRLYNLFIYSALVVTNGNTPTAEPRVIDAAAHIITLITKTLTIQRQELFAANLFSAYLHGDVQALAEGHWKIPSDKIFMPMEQNASAPQKNLMALFSAGIVPLRKEVAFNLDSLDDFLRTVIHWSNASSTSLQHRAAWCTLTSLVNKRAEDIAVFLKYMIETYWTAEILDPELIADKRIHAIRTWIWVSKALVVRSHPEAMSFVNKLFDILGDRDVGSYAANGIGEIAGPDDTLTKQNYAIVKILYAQKYFNTLLPRLIGGATSNTPQEQLPYLVALTSLIRFAPQRTYEHQMSTLMPLLIRGLGLPDAKIRADVIETLLAAVGKEPTEDPSISEHASTLVSAMLNNCITAEMASTRVRVAAVRYLGILPTVVRYDILHPHKPTVLSVLAKVLDDPKRVVRKEAVDTRTIWFKYNG
ncbi:ARM repeat-containing protein [Athelia psychrophila]|uniref:MMS19 nucleotide excision repair protein n=1 Tax=Athelia psychrophila TaxID=1759441 RepID=A0A166JN42_9AGAM|nr:ARM repeat-containing protein [Fibularhizoctonia sp. CBS 109695]